MSSRRVGIVVVGLALVAAACSSGTTTGAGDPGTTVASDAATGADAPGTTAVDDGTAPSVPIVDPASVEAFCALDRQLDDLAQQQLGGADTSDREAFRAKMQAFVADNSAVIDQYVAAAPSAIEADVNETMDQTRSAVEDPAQFADLLSDRGDKAASNRVSAFIDANCPKPEP